MPFLRALIGAGVRNPVLANLLMVCILVGGWFSTQGMVREAFPEFSLDHIAVEVVYPGATTEDVEHAICTPIEEALRGIEGVREISAAANEDFGTVWVALQTNVVDPAAVLKDVKDRVDQITDFPLEARKPVVRETSLRSEVINIAVHGDVAEGTLKDWAQEIRNDLTTFPEVSQVNLFGVRDDEILIEVSEQALQAFGLSIEQVMAAVGKGSLDLPAGVIRTAGEEYTLRVAGQRRRAVDYEDLIVLETPKATVRVGDVAAVREGFEDSVVRGRFDGQPAVFVTVYKTSQEDATRISTRVRDYVAERTPFLPPGLSLSVWGDTAVDVQARISNLVSNGLQGLIILFITMWLFLDFKLAFWVAAGIPISFAGSLLAMDWLGQSINVITLFALIMVSGIIVDDSIVIAESVHSRRQAGDPPTEASIEGTARVTLPVMGSTLTTIVAFIPLMYVTGVMGRFVYALPVVVIAALIASSVEGLWIQPAHLCFGERPGEAYVAKEPNRFRKWVERMFDRMIIGWYRPIYHLCTRNPYATLAASVFILMGSMGFWLSGRLPFTLFPKEDGALLRARVKLPEGTPASVSGDVIEQLERAALSLNDEPSLKPAAKGKLVQRVASISGEFANFLPVRGSHLSEVRVELMRPELRRIGDAEVIEAWRKKIGVVHDAVEFTITRQALGPTEQPIEVRLLGDDLETLKRASLRVQDKLREFAGVTDVYDDLTPGKRQLKVNLRPEARVQGVTLEDLARQLRFGFFGGEVVKLYRGRDQVTVRVRYPEDERRSIVDLENLKITTRAGAQVPFFEVAEVELDRGHAMVMHQDGRRRVRVLADIDERVANADRIVRTLDGGALNEILADFHGLRYTFGGDRARADESLGSLFKGFAIALLANYAFLAAILRSFAKPVAIFAAIPFGMIGVVAGHVLLGYDMTMMSLFGVVGVAGLVVNESLVLIDALNWLIREEGKSVREAVFLVGEQRFRPIVLTSITDFAGLLPLLLNSSGYAQAVQPMAVSLSFGLLASAALNLLVIPALYLIINDGLRALHWLRYGGAYPSAEAVETMVRGQAAPA